MNLLWLEAAVPSSTMAAWVVRQYKKYNHNLNLVVVSLMRHFLEYMMKHCIAYRGSTYYPPLINLRSIPCSRPALGKP